MEKLNQDPTPPAAELNQDPTPPSAETITPRTFAEIVADINSTDVDVPDALNSTNPEAKTIFMNDPTLRVPPNTHDRLDGDAALRNAQLLSRIQTELAENSALTDQQKRAAQAALDFSELKNVFLLANACYNEHPTPENAEAYRIANEALYGRPDENDFRAFLADRFAQISAREPDFTPEEQQEYAELKDLLGPVPPPDRPRYRPRPETVQRFSEMAREFMSPLFAHIPEGQDEFTPAETADIIKAAFADFVPEDSAWRVEVEPNRTAINVNQVEKVIKLAGKRPNGNLDRLGLEKIIAHEVGTHFMRALPYENFSVSMFRTGMPGYEAFEEGVARVAEQGIAGQYETAGINYYIGIGLANFKGCDFRQTYEIQRRLLHLATGKRQDSLAYNTTQRAFRGTDVLPNHKDLIYYNGNQQVWRYIEEHIDDPTLFDSLYLSGKTDIEDPVEERLAYESKVGGLA